MESGRGVTPLTLALEPGAHTITVRSGGDERVVPLTIAAGAEVTQYYEMKVVGAGDCRRQPVDCDRPARRARRRRRQAARHFADHGRRPRRRSRTR